MIKNNKLKLIIASVIILLPMVFGLLAWNVLPDEIPVHWNANGEVDNYESKAFAVFFLPLFLFGVNWLCIVATALDPKNKGQNVKPVNIIIWAIPVISLVLGFVMYGTALGYKIRADMLLMLLVGSMILIIGNYLPKCKQNYSLGIKIVWTLESEENWNATHRIGGKVWTVGGILLLACAFLPAPVTAIVTLATFLTIVLIPVVYSYNYYKKHSENKEDK